MKMDEYVTVAARAEDEFVERRSRFIGCITPVSTEDEATVFISEKKAAHWDAAHNVYAYILREGAQRYSDDGEPQGTAGIPVLEVLRKEGLSDVAVVVTRYFGGVLLGAGGLVRAYSHGAKLAVDAARRRVMCRCTALTMEFGYDFYGKFTHMLQNYKTAPLDSDFGASVRVDLLLRDQDRENFRRDLTELSAGTVEAVELDRRWAEIV